MQSEKIEYHTERVEVSYMPKGKRHSAQFKFKVALEAAKGTKTLSELASQYGLHPSQISEWKQQLLQDGPSVFSTQTARQQREQEALQTELYEQIGRLKMELEWLKKKSYRMTFRPSVR
jgi:transposase-like protein